MQPTDIHRHSNSAQTTMNTTILPVSFNIKMLVLLCVESVHCSSFQNNFPTDFTPNAK